MSTLRPTLALLLLAAPLAAQTPDAGIVPILLRGDNVQSALDPESGLELGAVGRYRYHAEPDRQYGRFSLRQGLTGQLGGKLDLSFQESVLYWGGQPGWDAVAIGMVEPFDAVPLAVDGSYQAGLKPLPERPDIMGSYHYADVFVDWMSNDRQWMVSAGYGFTGIAVALMGRNHPLGIVLAALLFGALFQGGAELSFEIPTITRDLVVVIQGLVILFCGALERMPAPWLDALAGRLAGRGSA